jgi:hypothetical protein
MMDGLDFDIITGAVAVLVLMLVAAIGLAAWVGVMLF